MAILFMGELLFTQIHDPKIIAPITEVKQIGTGGCYMIRNTKFFADEWFNQPLQ
jgi:hypothetical protein